MVKYLETSVKQPYVVWLWSFERNNKGCCYLYWMYPTCYKWNVFFEITVSMADLYLHVGYGISRARKPDDV